MVSLESFVNEINRIVAQTGPYVEKEQFFPQPEYLERICRELLYASTMREEGRYSSFRGCFIDSESLFLLLYIYSHTVLFKQPIRFTSKEIHRMAPAISAEIIYLILKSIDDQIFITGLIVGYTEWDQVKLGEKGVGVRMPAIANLLVIRGRRFGKGCCSMQRLPESFSFYQGLLPCFLRGKRMGRRSGWRWKRFGYRCSVCRCICWCTPSKAI